MPMIADLLVFSLGLVGLYFGAEWLVRGAARWARARGVSAVAVGLTIVAFGTSAPELVVSTVAAARGQEGVALGNAIGSNIVNVGLILGVVSLIRPLRVQMRLAAGEVPLLLVVSVAVPLLALDGRFGRVDAALLLGGFAGYLGFVLRIARRAPQLAEATYLEFEAAEFLEPRGKARGRELLLLLTAGLGALALGAHAAVAGAVGIASTFGISDVVIGLTVIAIGTSLPELATSMTAAVRGEADIAVGNIVGSNLFNLLAILGAAAAVRPLQVPGAFLRFEIPVMIGLSLLLWPIAWTGLRVERWEGGVLLAGFVAFQAWLIVRALA